MSRTGDPAGAVDGTGMAEASVALAELLVATAEGENVVTSPLSLQLALAMLREGASGRAAVQLDGVLGLSGVGGSQVVADLRAILSRFDGDVSTVDRKSPPERPLVHIADAVVVQTGVAVEREFVDRVTGRHAGQVLDADFRAGAAGPVLAAWVARETGGLLQQSPSDPGAGTCLALLDAMVFAATWRSPFQAVGTADRPFTRADGRVVPVPMMHRTLEAVYAAEEGWRAVELQYSGSFAMRVLLPDEDRPAGPAWSAVHEALDAAPPARVELTMPRWETDALLDLTPLLAELGLETLTTPDGDLDGVFEGAVVSSVAQAATITVAERGTVAAAVTQVLVSRTGFRIEKDLIMLRLDRPFEYQVIEQSTGLVLVAGSVADPS